MILPFHCKSLELRRTARNLCANIIPDLSLGGADIIQLAFLFFAFCISLIQSDPT